MEKENKKPQLEELLGIHVDEKFVPTQSQWSELYVEWHDDIVDSLFGWGSKAEVADAVSDSFFKLAGISNRFHLENPLEAKTLKNWWNTVRLQAKGVLGHERQRQHWRDANSNTISELNKKILREAKRSNPSRNEREDISHLRQLLGLLVEREGEERNVEMPGERMDAEQFNEGVRRFVARICSLHGIKSKNYLAFVRYVLDDCSACEVAQEIWGPMSLAELARRKNSLFVNKNKVLGWLKRFARDWKMSRGGSYRSFVEEVVL